MLAASATIWKIHTMDDHLFQNLMAIGWGKGVVYQPLAHLVMTDYKETTYPDSKKGSIATSAGILYRFVHSVLSVTFPHKQQKNY